MSRGDRTTSSLETTSDLVVGASEAGAARASDAAARAGRVAKESVAQLHALLGLIIAVGALSACGREDKSLELRSQDVEQPLETMVDAPLPSAYCEIDVEGVIVDTEAEYLPNVINCENGGANLEALKAQAIAARSVAYYAMATDGTICDSQGCQVYSCGKEPNALAIQAVEETRGQYLLYDGTLTYGFYVAGDPGVVPTACLGDIDAAATEQWVTYNEGKTGADVQQTDLGFVFPPFSNGWGQNRGCMSQWGARCLENGAGYDADAILRFYYGEDIVVSKATGPCVPDDGDTTGGDTGTSDSGSSDSGGTGGETGDPGTTDDGADGGTTADGGADAGDAGSAGGTDGGADDGADGASSDGAAGEDGAGQGDGRGDDRGCSVSRAASGAGPRGVGEGASWIALALGLAWAHRRRRVTA